MVSRGIRECLGCILCQKRLRLSWKVDECEPLVHGSDMTHSDLTVTVLGMPGGGGDAGCTVKPGVKLAEVLASLAEAAGGGGGGGGGGDGSGDGGGGGGGGSQDDDVIASEDDDDDGDDDGGDDDKSEAELKKLHCEARMQLLMLERRLAAKKRQRRAEDGDNADEQGTGKRARAGAGAAAEAGAAPRS